VTERTSRISADDIADALGRFRPTDEQRRVIEAPLTPALVVAGAGSGKTETMANRVLWLIANGEVRAGEVLGLTFTRKAAGELASRVRERIAELAAAKLVPGDYDAFEVPTVSTYNAFANALYRDNASVLGRESDGAVLGEAAAWQLARSVVRKSTHPGLAGLGKMLDPVTRAVLGISRGLADNVADPEAVREFALRFVQVGELPSGSTRGEFEGVVALAQTIGGLDVLVDVAAEYQRAKRERDLVEYSDQVAFALDIVGRAPRVAADARVMFRVVLLDEYQDTSVVQTRLLAELFGGHPVMAVGDPNQSIYGWRGASASNLDEFGVRFRAEHTFTLSTSWRNGHGILRAANAIVEPFRGGRVTVPTLVASSTASDLPVDSLYAETIEEEADEAAAWLQERLRQRDVDGNPPSAAILFRTRKAQGYFLEALRERGIPFHVLGVGGLLAEPEIADLVSALAVVDDPGAGLELIRLLAGSRWRVGVQDLHALNRIASWLRDRDYAQRQLDDDLRERLRASVTAGEGGSIVDALDFVSTAKHGHTALEAFTPLGLERLRDAGSMLARLRSRSSLDLPDFVAYVMHELQLDIEVAANDYRALGTAALDALFDALGSYLAIHESADLSGFLSWLREAELREDLSPRPEDPEPGTVQVLTIHGAKGLEWDLVVVPRMVDKELPGQPLEGYTGWLSFGLLPWPFRGDAAELPVFEWEGKTTRKEISDEQARFSQLVRERSVDEERRLAYVAITRARHSLLLTGSFWATQVKPRDPSPFLRELEAVGAVGRLPESTIHLDNPLGERAERFTWPRDPLGRRRTVIEHSAAAVRAAEPAVAGQWEHEVSLLLAEREARLRGGATVALPTRVPASRFKEFLTDPAAVAASLRRPMPERPYRATQLGTLFHAWVEDRYGAGDVTDELDALSTESDTEDFVGVDDAQLAALKRTFEASPWAGRRPVEVEREIHLPFAGRIVICKIDAVYDLPDGRFQVVDWKTGKAPKDAKDLEEKQLQLALYRLAYAHWRGIDPERIDAVFYYVADDRVIAPERIFGEGELLERWRDVFGPAEPDPPVASDPADDGPAPDDSAQEPDDEA
jgi:DNA helicase-2/ATP-dependent DNA helicase PcrA